MHVYYPELQTWALLLEIRSKSRTTYLFHDNYIILNYIYIIILYILNIGGHLESKSVCLIYDMFKDFVVIDTS